MIHTMAQKHLVTFLLALISATSGVDLHVYPSGLWLIPEDTNVTLTLGLSFNFSNPLDVAMNASGSHLVVQVVIDEDWKLNFVNQSAHFTSKEVIRGVNKSIVLSGYYWGRTQLSFYLCVDRVDERFIASDHFVNGTLLRNDVTVGVNRAFSLIDNIFMTIGTVFIFINTINMGCELNLKIIWECLRKPLGPLCGFLSQFGFMPMFSYWMGYLFFDSALFRLGLFTLGCSPGGLMSNFWTLMFNGDINLSIAMTFVSTVAAMGMMPLWMFTIGKWISDNDKNLQIPFSNLIISLVTLTVPLGVGILIKYKRPSWSQKLSRIIKPFTFGILIFFFTIGIYNSYKIFVLMTPSMYLAGFLVAFVGFLFGAVFAISFCLKKDQIIAISIETAMQNAGTGFIVLKLSLPSPDGDIASLPLMAQAFLTGFLLLAIYASYLATRRLCYTVPPNKDTLKNNALVDISSIGDIGMGKKLLIEDDNVENVKTVVLPECHRGNFKNVLNFDGLTKKFKRLESESNVCSASDI